MIYVHFYSAKYLVMAWNMQFEFRQIRKLGFAASLTEWSLLLTSLTYVPFADSLSFPWGAAPPRVVSANLAIYGPVVISLANSWSNCVAARERRLARNANCLASLAAASNSRHAAVNAKRASRKRHKADFYIQLNSELQQYVNSCGTSGFGSRRRRNGSTSSYSLVV